MTKPSGERVTCEEEDCNKSYANKYNMKEHMKKNHQSVAQSLVTSVVNFLSPQPNKEASTNVNISAAKELFVDSEDDNVALNTAADDMELLQSEFSHELEVTMVPIMPEKEWLHNTMPAGDLSKALGQVQNINKATEKHCDNQLFT